MGFRTIVVKTGAKLECRLNSLIIRRESEIKVFIREINTLIIESTAVSLTSALLCELVKNNVKIIFCDENHNPHSEILPYYGVHNTSKRYKEQFLWNPEIKSLVWTKIIYLKILEQSLYLRERGFIEQAAMLDGYLLELRDGDSTNREGHAAKVYFNCLLGKDCSRNDENFINGCLNYGYSILLSAFNREIVANGYLTQIGIWHDNEFNEFNLACDLMEPFRVIVDRVAFDIKENDANFKKKLVNILNFKTETEGKTTTLDLALRTYVRSIIKILNTGEGEILYPDKIYIEDEL